MNVKVNLQLVTELTREMAQVVEVDKVSFLFVKRKRKPR